MANIHIQTIHEALLTLHKEFDILNRENERVQGIINGTHLKLTELIKEDRTPISKQKIIKKRKLSKKHKFAISEAHLTKAKKNSAETSGNGSTRSAPRSHLTDGERKAIKELDKQGFSGMKIAKQIGRSQSAVAKAILLMKKKLIKEVQSNQKHRS